MAWTRKILRTWSAVSLALVVYAAIPHVHSDAEEARGAGSFAGLSEAGVPLADATSSLTSDDAHESHSPTASIDEHPCTLCREKGNRELTAPAPAPLRLATPTALRIDVPVAAARAELLLARRHPARGPPHA